MLLHWLLTSRSWFTASACTRLENFFTNSCGLEAAVCWAIAVTTLRRFFERWLTSFINRRICCSACL